MAISPDDPRLLDSGADPNSYSPAPQGYKWQWLDTGGPDAHWTLINPDAAGMSVPGGHGIHQGFGWTDTWRPAIETVGGTLLGGYLGGLGFGGEAGAAGGAAGGGEGAAAGGLGGASGISEAGLGSALFGPGEAAGAGGVGAAGGAGTAGTAGTAGGTGLSLGGGAAGATEAAGAGASGGSGAGSAASFGANQTVTSGAGSGTALSRILDGTASSADWLSAGGNLASTWLGIAGSRNQANAYRDLQNQYMAMGAPSRSRYEASMTPGFDPTSIPGYSGAVDTASKGILARLAASGGNPWGNPGGLIEANKQIISGTALPAIQQYQNQNAATGGYGAFNTAAPAAASNAINSQGGVYNAVGSGLAGLLNPQPSLLDTLRGLGVQGLS